MITANMEKVFLHHIFNNPAQFREISSEYFKNNDVKFVYTAVQQEVIRTDGETPTLTEIRDLVKMNDKNNSYTPDLITQILKIDMKQYGDEFLLPRFKTWKLVNSMRHGLAESVDIIRDLDDTDYDGVVKAAEELRDKTIKSTQIDLVDDDDLGSDFDDAEAHNQDLAATKIPSGWETMDKMTNGGWGRKELYVILGQTNVGKSLWLNNIATNIANNGHNVLYVTLEMSEKKVMKRIGSMRLKIPIAEYDRLSKNTEYIASKIAELKKNSVNFGPFDNKIGRIFVKEFPAGTLTVSALDDFVGKLEKLKGFKIDAIVLDYIALMCPEKRLNIDSNLYQKGKHIAEGIRSIAQKRDLTMITVTQVVKEVYNGNDLNLNDIPESKAIAETADNVYAIICNPTMKLNNIYHLKYLKMRDAGFDFEKTKFDFDRKYLWLHNDKMVETA